MKLKNVKPEVCQDAVGFDKCACHISEIDEEKL